MNINKGIERLCLDVIGPLTLLSCAQFFCRQINARYSICLRSLGVLYDQRYLE